MTCLPLFTESFLDGFRAADVPQISGQLARFGAALKEGGVTVGTHQVEKRALRAVQAREIAMEILEEFDRECLVVRGQDNERPDM
jgi:hypothetical protein